METLRVGIRRLPVGSWWIWEGSTRHGPNGQDPGRFSLISRPVAIPRSSRMGWRTPHQGTGLDGCGNCQSTSSLEAQTKTCVNYVYIAKYFGRYTRSQKAKSCHVHDCNCRLSRLDQAPDVLPDEIPFAFLDRGRLRNDYKRRRRQRPEGVAHSTSFTPIGSSQTHPAHSR